MFFRYLVKSEVFFLCIIKVRMNTAKSSSSVLIFYLPLRELIVFELQYRLRLFNPSKTVDMEGLALQKTKANKNDSIKSFGKQLFLIWN